MLPWDMFGPDIAGYRELSTLSKRYFSKSKLLIEGRASLRSRLSVHCGKEGAVE